MKKFMGKILGIFSDDLGIDLGTSNTLICMKNKGIILREPSVVAISTKTKEIFEVGEKAKHMIGRTPSTYETIRPLRNGVIADYEVTEKMLRSFYKRIKSGTFLNKPRVIICVPAGITQVEKRAVMEVTREAGAYGIQGYGRVLVERINGDYYSIMGFPISNFLKNLRKIGYKISQIDKI